MLVGEDEVLAAGAEVGLEDAGVGGGHEVESRTSYFLRKRLTPARWPGRRRIHQSNPTQEDPAWPKAIIDKGKGRIKEAAGDLTGDKSLKNEGKTDRAGGSVKNAVDSVTDKIKGKD